MGTNTFEEIQEKIITDSSNVAFTSKGWKPIYTASKTARIVIIGQAPGTAAQESQTPWNDKSGETLRLWTGISKEQFYDESLVSLLPMDFYYPGKNPKGGDLPPRKDFAAKWHPLLLNKMNQVELTLLVGAYSQKYYLGNSAKRNLTENIRSYKDYLPRYFPLVHPSPLAGRWRAKNPWFEKDVIPALRKTIQKTLNTVRHS